MTLNITRGKIPNDPASARLVHRFLQIQKTAHCSCDIRIDDRSWQVKGKTCDCAGSISSDAGEPHQFVHCGWKPFIPIDENNLRALVQIASPLVIAESLPGVKDFGLLGMR
jgi:hypothetical protein